MCGRLSWSIPLRPVPPRAACWPGDRPSSTCSAFGGTEPPAGVSARTVERLLTVDSRDAAKVQLGVDSLNTHAVTARYEAFPPEKANAAAGPLGIRHTPKR